MDDRNREWLSFVWRIVRSALLLLVLIVLLNEAFRFSQAWFAMFQSQRDARDAVTATVQQAPNNRDAAAFAAQAACAAHGVRLDRYSQRSTSGTVGQVVVANLQASRPVRGVLLAPLFMSLAKNRTLAGWRSQQPTLRSKWEVSVSLIE
jgi:hypothetical protein